MRTVFCDILYLYLGITEDGVTLSSARTFIFSGKANPQDKLAKLVIKFVTGLAALVNGNKLVSEQIKVVFVPDYRVSEPAHEP